MRRRDATYQAEPDKNEGHNRDHLNDGEPIFCFAEPLHAHSVDGDQASGYTGDPHPLRSVGKPDGKVEGNSRYLRADGQDLNERIRDANRESRPLVEVSMRVDAERSRNRMGDSHLPDGISDDERDDGAEEIGKDDAGAGELNGD